MFRISLAPVRVHRAHVRIVLLASITVLISWFALTSYSAKREQGRQTKLNQPWPEPTKKVSDQTRAVVDENYGKLPLRFEANRGQMQADSKFVARGPGYNIFFTPTEAVLVFSSRTPPSSGSAAASTGMGGRGQRLHEYLADIDNDDIKAQPTVLRMSLQGSNANAARIEGIEELPGKANYFIGNDSSKWLANVPTYAKVGYSNVYPGVDLIFYGHQQQLEYDLVVAPGSDPSVIQLKFEGAESLRVDRQGQLLLKTRSGEVRQGKPVIYQEIDGRRREVAGNYVLKPGNKIGFQVNRYDRARPLVIDPILVYSSMVNSGGQPLCMALDSDGAVYMAGVVDPFEVLGATPGAFQTAPGSGVADIFVTKLNPQGTAVEYSTYLSGNNETVAFAIDVDAAKNAYITGYVSGNFPTTSGAFKTQIEDLYDSFITKLNPTGSALVYSTLFGGNGYEEGDAIVIDSAGNAYISGVTESNNLPTTAGALSTTNSGGYDGFVAKFNTNGSAVPYCTYVGGDSYDGAFGLALDGPTNVYVTGESVSLNYPVANAFQQPHGGDRGPFKSTNNGNSWSLSRNGFGGGAVNALAVDPSNPSVVYAATQGGVWKTIDGGANWARTAAVQGHTYTVAVDPTNSQNVYAGSTRGFWKSVNGGGSWTLMNNGLVSAQFNNEFSRRILTIAIDRNTPSTIYIGSAIGIFKSIDAGGTWTFMNTGISSLTIRAIAIDPSATTTLYAISSSRFFKSTNGGANWTRIGTTIPGNGAHRALVIDPLTPNTLYVGSSFGVFKSTDGGANWSTVNNGLLQPFTDAVNRSPEIQALAIDPVTPTTIYAGAGYVLGTGYTKAGAFPLTAVFKSTDGGANWTAVTNNFNNINSNVLSLAVNPANPATVYAGTTGDAEAFVSRINLAGQPLGFSSYLGGKSFDYGATVVLDGSGDAYVTGYTQSVDFPTTPGAFQTSVSGANDVFVTRIGAASHAKVYSTRLGGNQTEEPYGIAVDSAGNAYVTGRTDSPNFPTTPGAFQTKIGNPGQLDFSDVFVTKLNPAGNTLGYSSYLGGAGDDGPNFYGFLPFDNIALDAQGNAYVVGVTGDSTTFPAFNQVNRAAQIANFPYGTFVAKISEATPSYSITGRITNAQGTGIAGIPVDAINTQGLTRTTVTDAQGNYAIASLPTGDYTVTPQRNSTTTPFHYTYTPSARQFLALSADQTADFTASQVVDIFGRVVSGTVPGLGIFDVTITATGTSTVTAITDVNGNFRLEGLLPGGNYTVTASKTGFTFSPPYDFMNLTSDLMNVVFGTDSATFFTITGKVADAGNTGIGNVSITTVVTSMLGSRTIQRLTDADGNYSIPNLQAEGNYVVTPSKSGFQFAPVSRSFPNLAANQVGNFLGTNCSFNLSANSQSVAATSGTGSVGVTTTSPLCGWTAVSNASWITVTSGASGTGDGTVGYSFTANPNSLPRVGTITIAGQTFTVNQAGVACAFNLSSASQAFTSTGGTGNVGVTANATDCQWTAVSNASWITITSAGGGIGNGSVNYSVAANTSSLARSGTITIAGQTFTVNQAGVVCAFNLSSNSQSFTSTGGTGSVNVTANASDCAWTATSNAPWITINSGASGNGNGGVGYSVAANTSSLARSGTMTIAGQTFTVNQAGVGCAFNLSATSQSFTATAGTGTVNVTANVSDCSWTSTSNAPWITINSGANGVGNGGVGYSVAANPSSLPRTGTITIAGQTFTVNQAGVACAFTLAPINQSFTAAGGTGSVGVTANVADCGWTASSNVPFITITSGATGTGNGTVNYSVAANTGAARSGLITIGGQVFPVSQSAGAGIQFSSPGFIVSEGAGSLPVLVTRSDSSAAATVEFTTSDTAGLTECNVFNGVASARCDYAANIGKLTFAPGEGIKFIVILLIDDSYAEGNESFTVTLSNATGNPLGGTPSTTVTIQDNETVNGPNPIDNVDFFIRQNYIDFLGREPDPAGLAGWRNVLNNCGTTVPPPCDRIEVSAGFFRSEEFQSRGYFIYRFYSAVGRIPLYNEFLPDFAKVSGFLTPAQLEANKVAYVDEFMARTEFQNKYAATFNSPTAYVDALLQTVGLPNHPSKPGWVTGLTNSSLTRAQVLRQLVESAEVYNKYYNEAFVIMQYFGYQRRTADASYLNWIQTMNQTGGDYRIMINGFLNSAEYRRRFGP